ncbi:MAG: MBL fold metallo-hydrolase, partial [Ferroplasma sp.]
IELILITHMHLDHYGGLPQLIWQRGLGNPDKNLTIVGPENIENTTKKILEYYSTPEYMARKTVFAASYPGVIISSGKHSIPDNTYKINIDGKYIFYSGDTSPSEKVIEAGKNSFLFIHDATYPDGMEAEAIKYGHSTSAGAYASFLKSSSKLFMPTHMSPESLADIKKLNDRRVIIPKEKMTYFM